MVQELFTLSPGGGVGARGDAVAQKPRGARFGLKTVYAIDSILQVSDVINEPVSNFFLKLTHDQDFKN